MMMLIHTNFDDLLDQICKLCRSGVYHRDVNLVNQKLCQNYVLTPGNARVAAGEADLQTGVYHRDVNLVTHTKLCFNIRKCKRYIWGACAAGPDLQTLGFTTVNHGVMYERPQPYQPHASQADQMFKCDECGTWFNPMTRRRVEIQVKNVNKEVNSSYMSSCFTRVKPQEAQETKLPQSVKRI